MLRRKQFLAGRRLAPKLGKMLDKIYFLEFSGPITSARIEAENSLMNHGDVVFSIAKSEEWELINELAEVMGSPSAIRGWIYSSVLTPLHGEVCIADA